MSDEPTVTFIKKRKGAPSGLRKRTAAEESTTDATTAASTSSEPSTSEVVIAIKRSAANHLIQGTGNKRRKAAEEAGLALSDSEDEAETAKRESYGVRHSAATQRERRRSSSPPAEMSAESIKAAQRNKLGEQGKEEIIDDGLYRGAAGQAHKLPKTFGPVKGGPGNVRTITLVDYQPDVCKDYKGELER